jgi:hypothetical protein
VRLEGVRSVSPKISLPTHTCEIVTRDGRLPDQKALARCIHGVGDPFTLGGVEARVAGRVTRRKGDLLLEIAGTGEQLRLRPLRHKVQWDRKSKKEQPATPAERNAYHSLAARWKGEPLEVEVVGPVRDPGDGKPATLEVREFTPDPKPPATSGAPGDQTQIAK